MAACVSRVELSVSCRSLLDRDLGSRSDPLRVLLQARAVAGGLRFSWQVHDILNSDLRLLDCMEKNKNCQDPEFCKKLVVDYYFEKVQKLKFSVYDIDKSFDLNDDDYLGGIECTVGQLSVTQPLELKQGKPAGEGTITTSAELIKDARVVYLEIEARNLNKKDFLGKSNPFLEFYKQSDAGTWQLAYRSEGQCADHDCDGPHDLIGTLQTTLAKIQTAGAGPLVEYECIHPQKKQKKNNYKNSGIIRIKFSKIETEYSFLDYVMEGCQINFTVAVDFTASSGDPKSPDSLYCISPEGINESLIAIWNVGSVVQDYHMDPRNSGFLPPDSASDPILQANKPLPYYKPCGKNPKFGLPLSAYREHVEALLAPQEALSQMVQLKCPSS